MPRPVRVDASEFWMLKQRIRLSDQIARIRDSSCRIAERLRLETLLKLVGILRQIRRTCRLKPDARQCNGPFRRTRAAGNTPAPTKLARRAAAVCAEVVVA